MSIMTREQREELQRRFGDAWPTHDPNHHPSLHLLAIERTGWRRWIFGRWVYSSEPFRRDIQRRCVGHDFDGQLAPWERICDPADYPGAEEGR